MSEQNPRIDERCYKALLRMILFGSSLYALAVVYLFFFLPDGMTFPKAFYYVQTFFVLANALLLSRLFFCRVRIDENGVDFDNLFGSSTVLRWDEIRTAAIVRLRVGGKQSQPLILLTTRPAEKALSHAAMTGSGKSRLRQDEHVRIELTPACRAAVEHYLHMTLKEYSL